VKFDGRFVRVPKNKRDKQRAKARKEIQKRSFWRRFFPSFLSLLKEKRPPEAKRTDCHDQSADWLAMTAQGGGCY